MSSRNSSLRPFVLAVLAGLVSRASVVRAEDGIRPAVDDGSTNSIVEEMRFRLTGAADFLHLFQSGPTLIGGAVAVDTQYALTEWWALGGGVQTGVLTAAAGLPFVDFHVFITRSFREAGLVGRKEIVKMGRIILNEVVSALPGGWNARLILSQFFLNVGTGLLPCLGLGASIHYDWNLDSSHPMSFGLRVDRLTDGIRSYFPVGLSLSIGVWL